MYSEWIDSGRLDLSFWSRWDGSRKTSKKAHSKEYGQWGAHGVQFRAIVQPTADAEKVAVDIVCLPLTAPAFKKYQHKDLAKEAGGFPSILVVDGSHRPMEFCPQVDLTEGTFGLPFWPVLEIKEEDNELPLGDQVVESVRSHWGTACMSSGVDLEEWLKLTSATPVLTPSTPCDYSWPPLVEKPVDREETSQGK